MEQQMRVIQILLFQRIRVLGNICFFITKNIKVWSGRFSSAPACFQIIKESDIGCESIDKKEKDRV